MGRGDLGRQVGVIDGGDLPIVNQIALKIYEGLEVLLDDLPQLRPDAQHHEPGGVGGLSAEPHKKLMLDTSREAQASAARLTRSVDNRRAKKELEPSA